MAANRHSPARVCIQCGEAGISGYKFCSTRCREDHRRRVNGIRSFEEIRADRSVRLARTCEACGTAFQQGNLSSKQIAAGHVQRFCSQACSQASRRKYENDAARKRAEYERRKERKGLWVPEQRECVTCGDAFTAIQPTMIACSSRCWLVHYRTEKFPERRLARSCRECAKTFEPAYGSKQRIFCSDECCRRSVRRSGKMVRRARQKSLPCEPIDAISVLARDEWTCQICGIPTPRELRGTVEPDAPELDHVVPLAAGGSHTYPNTQCACRRCNILKGARTESV